MPLPRTNNAGSTRSNGCDDTTIAGETEPIRGIGPWCPRRQDCSRRGGSDRRRPPRAFTRSRPGRLSWSRRRSAAGSTGDRPEQGVQRQRADLGQHPRQPSRRFQLRPAPPANADVAGPSRAGAGSPRALAVLTLARWSSTAVPAARRPVRGRRLPAKRPGCR